MGSLWGSLWIVILVMLPVLLIGIGVIVLVNRLDAEDEAQADDEAARWVNIV